MGVWCGSASACVSRGRPVRFASEFVFAGGTQLIVPNFSNPAKEPRNIPYPFEAQLKKKLRRQLCDYFLTDTS